MANSQALVVTIVILSIIADNRITYYFPQPVWLLLSCTTIEFVLIIINYHNIFCSSLYPQRLAWDMGGAQYLLNLIEYYTQHDR